MSCDNKYSIENIIKLTKYEILDIVGYEFEDLSFSNLRYTLVTYLVKNNLLDISILSSDEFWDKISSTFNNTIISTDVIKIVLLNTEDIDVIRLVSMLSNQFYDALNEKEFLLELSSTIINSNSISNTKLHYNKDNEIKTEIYHNIHDNYNNGYNNNYYSFIIWYYSNYYSDKCLTEICKIDTDQLVKYYYTSYEVGDIKTHNILKEILISRSENADNELNNICKTFQYIPVKYALCICKQLCIGDDVYPISRLVSQKTLDYLNGKGLTQEELNLFDLYFKNEENYCLNDALGYPDLFTIILKYSNDEQICLYDIKFDGNIDNIICKWIDNAIISLKLNNYDFNIIETLYTTVLSTALSSRSIGPSGEDNKDNKDISCEILKIGIKHNINKELMMECITNHDPDSMLPTNKMLLLLNSYNSYI